MAATNGYLEVCRMMIQRVEDKNPANIFGRTPLHFAAYNGHVDVCKLIIDNVDNKHPKDENGRTPKDMIGNRNFIETFQLFAS